MLRRLPTLIIQTRAASKLDDSKVKWVCPEYPAAYKPEASGDLEPAPKIPENALGLDYSLCDEIKEAPEAVKKLFSVDFLGKQQQNLLVKKLMMDRVRRHKYDDFTIETEIARITGHVRCLQGTIEEFPKNSKARQTAQDLIGRRKKFLNHMRAYDYKKFEWLLEKLNIEYKGYPEQAKRNTRKQSIRQLTEMYCNDIRDKKLADYRNLLESQQGPYLKQKLESLKFIRSEQKDLKLPVTVTDQDIQKVEKQLEEWTIKDELKKETKKKTRDLISE